MLLWQRILFNPRNIVVMVLLSIQVILGVLTLKDWTLVQVPELLRLADVFIAIRDGTLEGLRPLSLPPEERNSPCTVLISEKRLGPFMTCVMIATVEEVIGFGKFWRFKIESQPKPLANAFDVLNSQRRVTVPVMVSNPTNKKNTLHN